MKAPLGIISLGLLPLLLGGIRARPAPADVPDDPDATACPDGQMPQNYMQIAEAKNHDEVPPDPICPGKGAPGEGPPDQWQGGRSEPADPPPPAPSHTGAPVGSSTLHPDDKGQLRIPHKCMNYKLNFDAVRPGPGDDESYPFTSGWDTMCPNACKEFVSQQKDAGAIEKSVDAPCPCVGNEEYAWDASGNPWGEEHGWKVSWGDCICNDVGVDPIVTLIGTIVISTLPEIAKIGSEIMLQAFELVLAAPLNLIPGVGEVADAAIAGLGAAKLCEFAYGATTGFKSFFNWAKEIPDLPKDLKSVYNNFVKSPDDLIPGGFKPPKGVTKGGGKDGDAGAPKDWDKGGKSPAPGKGDPPPPKPNDPPPPKPNDPPPPKPGDPPPPKPGDPPPPKPGDPPPPKPGDPPPPKPGNPPPPRPPKNDPKNPKNPKKPKKPKQCNKKNNQKPMGGGKGGPKIGTPPK